MVGALNVVDVGGTYSDHMFGAYFGLAVSYILGTPTSEPEMGRSIVACMINRCFCPVFDL